eukprot:CAMPEP_0185160990 /NCGR_PEP_ID=MMETSP1139-20130426/4298_1 /TAXON_ID=298111 /ORGANISM="Pavlova sp., Strain CCMP459" /LENGTH=105 /DNA_ID=CAMNT_0027726219 /DNA_START=254 /DNA_END=571 /DNA_ORIENTATION=-
MRRPSVAWRMPGEVMRRWGETRGDFAFGERRGEIFGDFLALTRMRRRAPEGTLCTCAGRDEATALMTSWVISMFASSKLTLRVSEPHEVVNEVFATADERDDEDT